MKEMARLVILGILALSFAPATANAVTSIFYDDDINYNSLPGGGSITFSQNFQAGPAIWGSGIIIFPEFNMGSEVGTIGFGCLYGSSMRVTSVAPTELRFTVTGPEVSITTSKLYFPGKPQPSSVIGAQAWTWEAEITNIQTQGIKEIVLSFGSIIPPSGGPPSGSDSSGGDIVIPNPLPELPEIVPSLIRYMWRDYGHYMIIGTVAFIFIYSQIKPSGAKRKRKAYKKLQPEGKKVKKEVKKRLKNLRKDIWED